MDAATAARVAAAMRAHLDGRGTPESAAAAAAAAAGRGGSGGAAAAEDEEEDAAASDGGGGDEAPGYDEAGGSGDDAGARAIAEGIVQAASEAGPQLDGGALRPMPEEGEAAGGAAAAAAVGAGARAARGPVPEVLGPAPRGHSWVWLPRIRAALLRPAGWHAYQAEGRAVNMSSTTYTLSPQPLPALHESLSIVAYDRSAAEARPEGDVAGEALAQFLVAVHVRRVGPKEVSEGGVEVHETWRADPEPGVHVYGIDFSTSYTDYPEHPAARYGYRRRVAVVYTEAEDLVYEVTFAAPRAGWERAWAAGEALFDSVVVNVSG
jgi:hypothetical protein